MCGRLHLLTCFLFLLFFTASVVEASTRVGLDSVGIQKIGDRTFILHQVSAQETLFAISRRYKVPMVAIQDANETLKQGIKEGQTLLVPVEQAVDSTPQVGATASVAVPAAPVVTQTDELTITTNISPVKEENRAAFTEDKSSTLKGSTTHKIARGESLFAISKKYEVTIEELKEWNSLTSDKVMVGQSLKIFSKKLEKNAGLPAKPAVQGKADEPKVEEKNVQVKESTKEATAVKKEQEGAGGEDWKFHTVKAGESLFSIAKLFGTSIEDLIQWNSLTSNNIKVGQTVRVGKKGVESLPSETVAITYPPTTSASPTGVSVEDSNRAENSGKEQVNTSTLTGGFTNTRETGLAEVIPGTEANIKYLVLHRTAPIGSIIRVKNEENNLTIFARVVGVLPETGDNSKLLIKLSQAAFEQLKGVNSRFPVEILY